jgi:hypothetical protein
VLAAAFLATKSCAARDEKVDQDEAIAIAREQVAFTPDKVQVRYVQRGIPPEGFWAVSLYTVGAGGKPDRVRVILVNETTGDASNAVPRPSAGTRDAATAV